MRILHIYKDYYPVLGGMENHIRTLAEASAARGHPTTVLVTSLDHRTRYETLHQVNVVKTARWLNLSSAPISPALFWHARRLARNADIVHLHFPYPPGEMAHLLSGSRAKTVITYQSDIVRQRWLGLFYRPFLWRVLRHADALIATSERYRDTSPFLSRFKDKCVIIPNGSDLSRFEQFDAQKVAALRRRLLSKNLEQKFLLLHVGRLRYYKGLDDLIRAMPSLPQALAVFVGSGAMEAEWKQLAISTGVRERVLFIGDVSDDELPLYYAAADLYVLPANTRAEAYSISMTEALAAGCPCITTEVGSGTSWVNRDGETGLVIPPRDPAALAAAIQRLLDDEPLRHQMGQTARARAFSEFSHTTMLQQVHQLYERLLKS